MVDKWKDQNETYTADKMLLGGLHTIRVEYYEGAAGALMRFGYRRVGDITPPPGFDAATTRAPRWRARRCSCAGRRPSTSTGASVARPAPAGRRLLGAVDQDGGPARRRLHVHRHHRRRDAGAASTASSSSTSGGPAADRVRGPAVSLSEGSHAIVVEYFEHGGGAIARLDYDKTAEPAATGLGRASTSTTWTWPGHPVLTRSDTAIDYDWGLGAPDPGSRTTSSPRGGPGPRPMPPAPTTSWSRATTASGSRIDGVRGDRRLGRPSAHRLHANVDLTAGPHTVVVEYYENGGGALARASIVRL